MWQKGQTPVPGYRLEKFLGRGNFGEVWQSTSPGGTRCALKFLNLQEKQGRKEYRALQPLKQIRHANLMPLNAMWLLDERQQVIPDYDLLASNPMLEDSVRSTLVPPSAIPDEGKPKTLVIAMPLAEGNLLELLEQRKARSEDIPVEELLVYMMDAARALDFLNSPRHDLGSGRGSVQHGDVKPENLVLLGGSVMLCDFGVARTLGGGSDTRGTSLGGSWAYIAPECLNGQVSVHSDQFSLAISYVELRTGSLPFPEDSITRVVEDRKKGKLWLDGLTAAEQTVIRKACSVNPEKRFGSNVEMVEALRSAVLGTPSPAKGISRLIWVGVPMLLLITGLVSWKVYFSEPVPNRPPVDPPRLTGQELYAQAMLELKSSPANDSELQAATQSYVQALEAGFQVEAPQPLRAGVQLNETSGVYDVVALKSVTKLFAVHPITQRVLIVGDDGRSLVAPEQNTQEQPLSLELPAPIASVDWLDEKHLLVRDCAAGLWRVNVDTSMLEQIARGVLRVTSEPRRALAVAISDGDGTGKGEVMRIDVASTQVIMPPPEGLNAFSPLLAVNEDGTWAMLDEEVDGDGIATLISLDAGQAPSSIETAIKPYSIFCVRAGGKDYAVVGGQSLQAADAAAEASGVALVDLDQKRVAHATYLSSASDTNILVPRSRTVRSLAAFSPALDDGRAALIAAGQEATRGVAETEVWEVDSAGALKLWGTVGQPKAESVSAVAFDASGKWIAMGTDYGEVTLLELSDNREFQLSTVDYLADVIQLQIVDGKLICAFDDASVLVWNLDECKMILKACQQKAISLPKPTNIRPVAG